MIRGLLGQINVFREFSKLAAPLAIFGLFVLVITPGLLKLMPLVSIGGALWATFYVAKGFAIADEQHDD